MTLPPLPSHHRFAYSAIPRRPVYDWPNGGRLAVYLGFNIEHFAFGEGMGARLVAPVAGTDVLNYTWREYGNRVGAWRCLELFEQLKLPVGALVNTSLYDHCPELVAAFVARGDEIIGHGHTNAEAQGGFAPGEELALLRDCADRIARESGVRPTGWLSPWISESSATPDLLVQSGYRYTLNWGHDDQPVRMATAHGPLRSIPYPQELNDIPAIVTRQMTGEEFGDMIVDHFDEMLQQSNQQPLVMGIALHPYLVGQPHRLKHLRRALAHIAGEKSVWWTTPGRICDAVEAIGL